MHGIRLNLKSTSCRLTLAALLLAGLAATASAIPGTLVQSRNGSRLTGDIRWRMASKEYVVTSDGVSMTFRPSQVERVIVARPVEFDQGLEALKAKDFSTALAKFEEVMTTYKMLQWDVPATAYAATAHLALGNAKQAVTLCQMLIRANPDAAFDSQVAGVYWKALIEADREATLRNILETAIAEGSRELAALAQIRRGDLDMKHGRFREALVDGYLRTVVLYEDIEKHLPEALYKAAQCFEQLNETANANKMRKKLLADHPASPYAKRFSL